MNLETQPKTAISICYLPVPARREASRASGHAEDFEYSFVLFVFSLQADLGRKERFLIYLFILKS